ncbi:MAG: DUF1292 domain-containing protein [Clostridiales bacterium]|nr:DUF1292 domain-containing protein [Clostridiales bacterium]
MSDLDYTPDLYTLVDEEGNEETFEMMDVIEIDEQRYFALMPYLPEAEDLLDSDGELVILKSDIVDGEEILVSIDDDNEFDKIGKMFLERLEAMFEEVGCECDDDCDCNN